MKFLKVTSGAESMHFLVVFIQFDSMLQSFYLPINLSKMQRDRIPAFYGSSGVVAMNVSHSGHASGPALRMSRILGVVAMNLSHSGCSSNECIAFWACLWARAVEIGVVAVNVSHSGPASGPAL